MIASFGDALLQKFGNAARGLALGSVVNHDDSDDILAPRSSLSQEFVISAMDTYRNFIGGKWIESTSSKTVNNLNPANTDDVIGTVRQATREEARSAVEAAAEAFHDWRRTPAPARGKIVAQAARLIEAAKEELAETLTHEEG